MHSFGANMADFLSDERFSFLSPENKVFIYQFDERLKSLGYDHGDEIGSGYCWGRYMLIYRKTGVKSDRVYARIYLRESSIILRLFLSDIDKHRTYIEDSPEYIKQVFTGPEADCQHCHNEKDGDCRFRKSYTIDGRLIEKCSGITFEFHDPTTAKLPDYLSLFSEFYPQKRVAVAG
jgi:hypothetical protein